ncbi:hypothetical protein K488DRAFT_73198, partial [Vararia minispora EC-137]
MDTVPVRKRKAEDDQPSSTDAHPRAHAPPRLSLQTAPVAAAPPPPAASWPTDPDHDPDPTPEPGLHHALAVGRVKRPRIESDAAVPVLSPPPPSPAPTPEPGSPSRKRTPAQDLWSDVRTQHGRRWEWRTAPSGETRLVASFRPASHFARPADILLSQSEPPSPAAVQAPVSVVLPIDPASPHIPPRIPPINRATLRELDMHSILRNPQLRHDFLFDPGLQFRPSASRRKRAQAEAYWAALARELRDGCTCVSFDAHGRPASPAC